MISVEEEISNQANDEGEINGAFESFKITQPRDEMAT